MVMTAISVYFISSVSPLLPMAVRAARAARKASAPQAQAVSLPRSEGAGSIWRELHAIRIAPPISPVEDSVHA